MKIKKTVYLSILLLCLSFSTTTLVASGFANEKITGVGIGYDFNFASQGSWLGLHLQKGSYGYLSYNLHGGYSHNLESSGLVQAGAGVGYGVVCLNVTYLFMHGADSHGLRLSFSATYEELFGIQFIAPEFFAGFQFYFNGPAEATAVLGAKFFYNWN